MRGRRPKDPKLRQRRNRATTRATLATPSKAEKSKVPPLPKRSRGMGAWHARVKAWWQAVWRSPMAAKYLKADRMRLELIAELHQCFWRAIEEGEPVTKLAAEIRQQEVLFGLTPMDRRRLEWEVQDEQPEPKGDLKPDERAPQRPLKDPRGVLRAV